MARVIYGGSEEFDVLAFGRPDAHTVQFLTQQMEVMSRNMTQQALQFTQSLGAVHAAVDYDKLSEMAYRLNNQIENLISSNNAMVLATLEALQNADLFNQRFIMACPDIRMLYHSQQIEGYHGTYVDNSPGQVGFNHYDYRRATDQLVLFTDDGWEATTYYEDPLPGDRHLVLAEKSDIQLSWEAARYFIKKERKDPTSKDDNPL